MKKEMESARTCTLCITKQYSVFKTEKAENQNTLKIAGKS